MFSIGDYIVHGKNGVCKVEDITHLDVTGVDKDQLYYVLIPMKSPGSKVFYPVDSDKIVSRPVITKAEAKAMVEGMESVEPIWIDNERQREIRYKEAMNSGDCLQWIAIIKTLYLRNQERIEQGKKITFVDDKYYKEATDFLYDELSIALEIEKEEVKDYIFKHVK